MSFTHALATNRYGEADLIVSTSASNGTHTTLASAMSAAVSGQTIFLRDSVTENVTITPGVNITAWSGGTLNVPSITGTLTMTGAGTSTISGLRLVTNSAAIIAVTGSAASILNVNHCYLNCSNNTGISFTTSNASSQINCNYTFGDIGTTGIAIYSMSAAGSLNISYGEFTNSGGSSTANSNSAGSAIIADSFFKNPIGCTGTGIAAIDYSNVNTNAQNVTPITNASTTGAISSSYSTFAAGTASAINVSVSCTVNIKQCNLESVNTNTTTGSGTLNYSNITFGTSGTYNLNCGTNSGKAVAESNTPAVTVLTSGSGTYTTPTNTRYLTVKMVGGGGGGAASGTTPGAATAGNVSTFGTSLLTCNGGAAGLTNGTQAAGGTATGGDANLTGGASGVSAALANSTGGLGGCSFYGGFGQGGILGGGAGYAAAANSGSGGGGAGTAATAVTGGGGGAGGYLEKLISSPLATYAYAVGGTAAGGTLGTGGAAGGLGAAGNIIITAYYV